jgi:DNA-binding winged helix-turn-helix (wHTH) protein
MALQNDYPPIYVLEGRVRFDRQRRHLCTPQSLVELKENEARLLLALLEGVQDKRQIIEILWESRGVIVTENNYYKVVRGLRNAFDAIGLPADLLKTLPRVGLAYVGHCHAEDAGSDDGEVTAMPDEPVPVSRPPRVEVPRKDRLSGFLVLLAILLVGVLCGRLLLRSDNGFRLLGTQEGIRVYVYKDPGVPMVEVVARYRRFSLDQHNTRYLYYREVGKNYIILACPTGLPDGAESCVSLMQKNI